MITNGSFVSQLSSIDIGLSDHSAVFFNLELHRSSVPTNRTVTFRKWKSIDQTVFFNSVVSTLSDLHSTSLEEKVSQLNNALVTNLACCCHENLKFLFLADQYDSSSGSLQLISIKPMAAPPTYSHPASSDRSQDSAILNGEVRLDFIRDSLRRKPLTDHSLLTDLLMHFTLKKGCGYPIARSLLIG